MSGLKVLGALAAMGLGLFAASTAQAVVTPFGTPCYAINMTGGSTNPVIAPTALLPTDVAGAFPQGNWNNFVGFSGTLPALVDADGNISTVSLSVTGSNTWATSVGTGDADHRLMTGYVDSADNQTSTYKFSGLMPGTYSLVVYTLPDTLDGRDESFTINGNEATRVWVSSDSAANFINNGYVRAFATSKDGVGAAGNFVLFENFTVGEDGILTLNGRSETFRNYVNGLQLICLPEPASIGLVAFGAMGLLIRRRRA